MNMTEKLNNFFYGKSVLILGFGMEGRSTLKLLKNIPEGIKKIGIADINPLPDDLTDLNGFEKYTGKDYLSSIGEFDIVMKAPGVVLPFNMSMAQKEKITSQTDLLLRFSESTIIGITGTKGKSTTSSLIYHILEKCGKKAVLIGNIGVPPLDGLYDRDTLIVCEMSCHQLEYVKASPDIAVLLNIYEEHLDHYVNFDAYKATKENIYLYQENRGVLYYNRDLKSEKLMTACGEKISLALDMEGDVCVLENGVRILNKLIPFENIKTCLHGRHNLYNIAASAAVCVRLGCDLDNVLEAVGSFEGLPHRLEHAGRVNGADYINDSISTIPLASISALKTFPDSDTIILGGMDRGIDYKELIDFLDGGEHSLKNVIVLPDSGYRIADCLAQEKYSVYRACDLEDAVKYSVKVTKVRCILSPAAASYGFYKNFEERGEHFKRLVHDIS